MRSEKRNAPREAAELTISLADGSRGTTRDVSVSGLFFECSTDLAVGSEVSFSLEFDGLNRPLKLVSQGLIIRVEQKGERTGVGVKMLSTKFISV